MTLLLSVFAGVLSLLLQASLPSWQFGLSLLLSSAVLLCLKSRYLNSDNTEQQNKSPDQFPDQSPSKHLDPAIGQTMGRTMGRTISRAARSIAVLLITSFVGFSVGFMLAWCSAQYRLQQLLPVELDRKKFHITGTVVGLPTENTRRQLFTLKVEQLRAIKSEADVKGGAGLKAGASVNETAIFGGVSQVQLSVYHRPFYSSKKKKSSKASSAISKPKSSKTKTKNPAPCQFTFLQHGKIVEQQGCPKRLKAGQKLSATVVLRRPRGFVNPGGFDYQAFLMGGGIDATGYLKTLHSVNALPPTPWRYRLKLMIDEQKLEHGNLIKSLLLADRSGLDKEHWRVLSNTGTGHLLAISGMHIGMAAGIGFLIGSLLGRIFLCFGFSFGGRFVLAFRTSQQWALLGALIIAVFYSYLAGFSLPTQRALIMLLCVQLAIFCGRQWSMPRVFMLAAITVFVLNPLAISQVGASLSFAAVFALLYGFMGRPVPSTSSWFGRFWFYSKTLIRSQLLVSSFLLIFLFAFCLPVSQLSLAANLVAIPLVSFILLPLLLLATVISAMGFVVPELWQLVDGGFAWLWSYLQLLESIGFEYGISKYWMAWPYSFTTVVLIALACAWFWLPKGVPGRILFLVPVLVLAWPSTNISPVLANPQHTVKIQNAKSALPETLITASREEPIAGPGGEPIPRPTAEPVFTMTLLDVGQGTALVLQHKERAVIYDAGPKYSDKFNAGSSIVAPFLRRSGVQTIDLLIISHSDSDHSGGLLPLLEEFPVSQLWLEASHMSKVELDLKSINLKQPPLKLVNCQRGQLASLFPSSFGALSTSASFQNRSSQTQSSQAQSFQTHNSHTSKHHAQTKLEVLWPLANTAAELKNNNRSCVVNIQLGNTSILLAGDIEAKAERALLKLQPLGSVDILLTPHHGSKSSSHDLWVQQLSPRYLLGSSGFKNRYRHPHPSVLQRYQEQGSRHLFNTAQSGAVTFEFDGQGNILNISRQRLDQSRWWYW